MKTIASTFSRLIGFALVLSISVAVHGQTFNMDNVFTDDLGHPSANAEVTYTLANGSTDVEINVSDAVPNQFWSVWMKLDGASPLTGIGSFPLINAADISPMASATPVEWLTPTANALGLVGDDGTGSTNSPNGFFTDANGDATFSITLDYPLIQGGSFPFDQFDPSLSPVPLGSDPFLLSTLIHTDDVGHGLFPDGGPGTAAPWFNTTQFAVPEPSALLLLAVTCVAGTAMRFPKTRLKARR